MRVPSSTTETTETAESAVTTETEDSAQTPKAEISNEAPEPLIKACFVCMSEEDLILCPDCKIIYYCGQVGLYRAEISSRAFEPSF